MHRLQTVAHIGERAANDDRHGVVEITAPHFVFDIDGRFLLVLHELFFLSSNRSLLLPVLLSTTARLIFAARRTPIARSPRNFRPPHSAPDALTISADSEIRFRHRLHD